MCFAGGIDRLLAHRGVPIPGGVRARAAIDDRTRKFSLSECEDERYIEDRTGTSLFPEREVDNRAFFAAGPAVKGIRKGQAEQ